MEKLSLYKGSLDLQKMTEYLGKMSLTTIKTFGFLFDLLGIDSGDLYNKVKLKGTDAYFDKYQLGLNKIVSYVQQKEIRRPITKASIQTNWKVIATEKEQGMGQIYYYKQVEDNQIEELINSLPFTIL